MATYYAINAGGNWSAGATWSTIATKDASRVGDGSQPTALDDCILDDYSGAVTVNTTTCLAKTVVCTGYTALLTFTASQKLTVSGSVTFAATHTIAGTGTLAFNAPATLTMGGLTFPGSLSLAGTTLTLAADTTFTGSLTSASGTNVMNGNTCYIGGSLTCTVDLSGTTTLVMNGTGTLSSSGSTATLWNNLTVNTAGTITWGAFFSYRTGVFTWTSGTHAGGLGNFYINSNCTLTISSGKIPMTLRAQISTVITLGADLHINSIQTTVAGYLRPEFKGAFNIYADTYSVVDYGLSANGHIFASGTTLTVSTELRLLSTLSSSGVKSTILIGSKTPSSPFYLNYTGTPQNCLCVGVTFVDCDASGSAQEIKNYNGGTLTRCTNIRNVNLPVIPSSVSIGG